MFEKFRKKVIFQLYPAYLLTVIAAIVIVGWFCAFSFRTFYINRIKSELETRAELLSANLTNQTTDPTTAELLENFRNLTKADNFVTLISPEGKVLADTHSQPGAMGNLSTSPEFLSAVNSGRGISKRYSRVLGERMIYTALSVKHNQKLLAVIRTAMPLTEIENKLQTIYTKIFWAGFITAVLAGVISYKISRRITKPIDRMEKTAAKFAKGELNHRMSIPSQQELADLAKTMNEMARQLSRRIDTLTKQRNESEAVLASMIEGVLAVDSQGHIVRINKAAARLLDIDPQKAEGHHVEEIIRNTELQEFVKKAVTSPEVIEKDISLPETERQRYFQLHGAGLIDRRHSIGAVIVLNDVTRLRSLENIRKDFAANVSHELKTPITSIQGFVETLLDGAADDPKQARKFLDIIAKHTERLNAIIEDLMSLARLEDSQSKEKIEYRNIELTEVLEESARNYQAKADEKNITIKTECDENLKISANYELLAQAVSNLVENAVKYSPENSEVKISASKEKKEVVISVSDNGTGIEKHHLPRLFERFYVVDKSRSKNLGGTGLGLAIVKHIAQVHGGFVTVESQPGKGATFKIHIPEN
jgi:two-component system phosphate regulon sensor histidine kinase PhoR